MSSRSSRHKKKGLTIEMVTKALKSGGGVHSEAAKLLGVDRSAVSHWVSKHPELQALVKDAKESAIDLAESKLLEKVRKGHLGAICFFLKCQAKHRGYVERQELKTETEEQVSREAVTLAEVFPPEELEDFHRRLLAHQEKKNKGAEVSEFPKRAVS